MEFSVIKIILFNFSGIHIMDSAKLILSNFVMKKLFSNTRKIFHVVVFCNTIFFLQTLLRSTYVVIMASDIDTNTTH